MPKLTGRQWVWIASTYLIYSFIFGWSIAAAFVVAIGFHEYCHLLMAHRLGMPTRGFTMLPFIGGMAYATGQYKSLWNQAKIVFAGPIGGGLLAFLTFGVYLITNSVWFSTVAFYMAILNLFNLLPLAFMDGGQLMNTITYSINRKIGLRIAMGSTIVAVLLIGWFNPILAVFVGILGLMHIKREYRNQKFMAEGKSWMCTPDFLNKPYPLNKKQIRNVSIIWIVSILTLGIFCLLLAHSPLFNLSVLLGRS